MPLLGVLRTLPGGSTGSCRCPAAWAIWLARRPRLAVPRRARRALTGGRGELAEGHSHSRSWSCVLGLCEAGYGVDTDDSC